MLCDAASKEREDQYYFSILVISSSFQIAGKKYKSITLNIRNHNLKHLIYRFQ